MKRKSETKQPKAKRRKIEETAATTSQQDTAFQPGDFVTVGLKPRKGPISVYVAEITSKSETEYGLKYMKKAGNAYVWPEKSDVSQEPTEHIISKLEAPELVNERGHFKFNTQELSKVKVNLLKIHKRVFQIENVEHVLVLTMCRVRNRSAVYFYLIQKYVLLI